MKQRNLKIGLSAIALFGLVGAGFGLSQGRSVAEVNATDLIEPAAGLTRLYLDLSGSEYDWTQSNAVLAVHTWDNKVDKKYVATHAGGKFYYADANLEGLVGFEFVRYAPDNTDPSSIWTKGAWNTDMSMNYYSATGTSDASGTWSKVLTNNWQVVGASSGTWTGETQDINLDLGGVQLDKDGLQVYSRSIALTKDSVFKVEQTDVKDYLGSNKFSTNALGNEYLDIDEDNDSNITVKKSGTFEFYVKPATRTVWVQVNSQTEVEKFAEDFLAATDTICTGADLEDNTAALEAIWAAQKKAYGDMTVGAKGLFNSENPSATVKNAFARYQFIIGKYTTLAVWEEEPDSGNPTVIHNGNNQNYSPIVFAVIMGGALIIGLITLFALRKKKDR